MSSTVFSFPTPTVFGAGAIAELPSRIERLRIKRPLVVTDPGLLPTGAFQSLAQALGKERQNETWFVYSGVHANPVENDVREAAALFRQQACDSVIALGGGSPLDVGKAARLLAKRPDFKLERFYEEPDWSGLAS